MGRLPGNPYANSGRLFKAIKELIANSTEDRNLALLVFREAKAILDDPQRSLTEDKDSLRSLMVESLKLAQSSKSANIKAVELYMKHQDSMLDQSMDEAKRVTNEGFMGD